MLYLIGLGLGDVRDVTVKGLEAIKAARTVYLETYTSILPHGPEQNHLEQFYGRHIKLADRDFVEQNSDELLSEAVNEDVCLLVVGDPFGATTHCDLLLRAKEKQIKVNVIHNASIMNAVGCCGLQLYSFGETVSIVFWTDTWQPDSYYDKIAANRQRGLHTLCLLDIRVKEPTLESMTRKRKIYDPPRYMTASEAAEQLLLIETRRRSKSSSHAHAYTPDTLCVGLARIGWDDQRIVCCSLKEMTETNLGPPLHSLVITGKIHLVEEEMLKLWMCASCNDVQGDGDAA